MRVLAELSKETGGEYVPTHKLVRRLGRSPGLGLVLENLINDGLVERGHTAHHGWGERPTEAGYRELNQPNPSGWQPKSVTLTGDAHPSEGAHDDKWGLPPSPWGGE
jgi:hypothetical protein